MHHQKITRETPLGPVRQGTSDKAISARLTTQEISFLDATVAGFRTVFGTRPERVRFMRGDNLELLAVECSGVVEESAP